VALRGVALARIDPRWWKAPTAPPPTSKHAETAKVSRTIDAVFDVQTEMCTPFLHMPSDFVANPEYWKDECKSVPKQATHIKMTVGDVTDYFKPKAGRSMCDMLVSADQHMWSSDGVAWKAVAMVSASTVGLGGSADGWLNNGANATDKRDTPSFWGVRAGAVQKGGCCHSDYKTVGKAWAKPYEMEYCGVPVALAPICTPLVTVAGSSSADTAFWAQTCKQIPLTTSFIKVAMGSSVDYYRPQPTRHGVTCSQRATITSGARTVLTSPHRSTPCMV